MFPLAGVGGRAHGVAEEYTENGDGALIDTSEATSCHRQLDRTLAELCKFPAEVATASHNGSSLILPEVLALNHRVALGFNRAVEDLPASVFTRSAAESMSLTLK